MDQACDFPFFAMELIRGHSLKHRLTNGPLLFAKVLGIAAQLAGALWQVLQFDIVHSDVKPVNILQSEDGAIKLSDFDLVRRLSKLQSDKGQFVGTPNYLSPETADQKPSAFAATCIPSASPSLNSPLADNLTPTPPPLSKNGSKPTNFSPFNFPKNGRRLCSRPACYFGATASQETGKSIRLRYASYNELLRAIDLAKLLKLHLAGRFQRGMAP